MNLQGAFLAFTCISIAGLCHATADELLDLETCDLSEMKTVSGITVVFDPGKINMVYTLPRSSGRSSGRSGSITNIIGLSGGPQEVGETADRLLAPESEAILYIADVAARDSGMDEGFLGLSISLHRTLESDSGLGATV